MNFLQFLFGSLDDDIAHYGFVEKAGGLNLVWFFYMGFASIIMPTLLELCR